MDYKPNRKAHQSQEDRVLEKTLLREKVVRAVKPVEEPPAKAEAIALAHSPAAA